MENAAELGQSLVQPHGAVLNRAIIKAAKPKIKKALPANLFVFATALGKVLYKLSPK